MAEWDYSRPFLYPGYPKELVPSWNRLAPPMPLRIATFDVLHRNELSGALSGLTRVRQFQMDDCHIFLTEHQIADEVRRLADFILGFYATFGLEAKLKFGTRPATRIGDDAMWDESIQRLRYREGSDRTVLMEPGTANRVEVGPLTTSNWFGPGHRLRIEVSSSNFPRFDRNQNTGGNNYDETAGVVARNAIHHSSRHPSQIRVTVR